MFDSVVHLGNIQGLTGLEVSNLQATLGKNVLRTGSSHRIFHIAWDIVKEPMFILLVIACSLYFILGEISEGIMMGMAMCLVAAISLYQEVKSSHALNALSQLVELKVLVVRDGHEVIITAEELVPGDIVLLEEGMRIPADGIILQENDLTVDESVVTGESLPVDKHESEGNNLLYQGTTINSGKCTARITAIGKSTKLGKIGKAVGAYQPSRTLLQNQINRFVRRLALFGLAGFLIIFFINYLHYKEWTTSLLFALTLAMSAVPEEIPVAFSSFMALGAYKMSRLGIISRQPQVVENLGSVSVICLDKTGTITENKMRVKMIYDYSNEKLVDLEDRGSVYPNTVLHYGALASETNPFDAMEKAIYEAYRLCSGGPVTPPMKMIYEYPLQGHPPMMTHVYENKNEKIVAGKGGAERILRICGLDADVIKKVNGQIVSLASKGYRVIGVASAMHTNAQLPVRQDNYNWQFEGLLAIYDPPKKNIPEVITRFYAAGISVKLLTGDYPDTAIAIARQVNISNPLKCITGDQIMEMKGDELKETVKNTSVFARMFPDAKVKVIEALKKSGETVAMTGDGVNDGPALKTAHVGIAMGQRGTEIARQASDLVLIDDNLEKMVTAIREGRGIYSNLKKAVRYIISIHIPILLVASLPVIFGWAYPNIFTPIHVIFMELIMGPTCSIFFEKEPVEENIMRESPRQRGLRLFSPDELLISIVQGIVITLAVLLLYYYFMQSNYSLEQTRTVVFTTLILSNVFLTFANRSFSKTIYFTSRFKNSLAPFVLISSALFLGAMHFIPFFRSLFQLAPVTFGQFSLCLGAAFASVMWIELHKTR